MKKSAEGFTRIAREVFAPIYPVIAEQVLTWSGIRDGLSLDLGSGPGLLSAALAEKSGLSVIALDTDPAMARITHETAAGHGCADRITPITGDVHCMPVRDDTVSLIVSRGSIFFWKDRVRAFQEIELGSPARRRRAHRRQFRDSRAPRDHLHRDAAAEP